jgi:putative transcriptional regulator
LVEKTQQRDDRRVVRMKMDEMRRLRRAAELTQQELADRAGVSKWTVHSAENGHHVPHFGTITKLADALGVPAETIFPKGNAPRSSASEAAGREGTHQSRTARSYVAPITGASGATVVVDLEAFRDALRSVELGILSADAAEERLLAGVA